MMPIKKTKKFNVGGMLGSSESTTSLPQSLQPFMDSTVSSGSGGSSANAGLGQLASGAETINKAIQSASNALTGSAVQGSLDGISSQHSAPYKKGGILKKYAKGGAVSASKRGDGIAQRGKTKGRII